MQNKISVIIPVYNDKENFEKVLTELLTQKTKSYPETEIIVINDGSTDGLDSSKWEKEKIIWFNFDKNKGCAAARNKGLELATGKYIAFVDSDDMVTKDYLHMIYTTIRGTAYNYIMLPWKIDNQDIEFNIPFENFPTETSSHVWSYVFDREILNMEKFDEKLNIDIDIDFLNRQLKADIPCGFILKPIYLKNTQNKNSLTNRFLRNEITKIRNEIPNSQNSKTIKRKIIKKRK